MAIVVAFVSQKGGVGKSTLARALATSSVRAGLAVKTVDLDPEQATITVWAQTRDRYEVSPSIKVDAFRFVKDALASARGEEFVIIDTPVNRTLADDEASNARAYLSELGFAVLAGDIPERLEYRTAMNQGQSITEASQEILSARADTMIADLLAEWTNA